MVSKNVVIKNPTGLHLRPAGLLCKEALRYQASIKFQFENTTANAKSVLSVLGACVKCGDEITFICEGVDEEQALADMVALEWTWRIIIYVSIFVMLWRRYAFCIQRPLLYVGIQPDGGRCVSVFLRLQKERESASSKGTVFCILGRRTGHFLSEAKPPADRLGYGHLGMFFRRLHCILDSV